MGTYPGHEERRPDNHNQFKAMANGAVHTGFYDTVHTRFDDTVHTGFNVVRDDGSVAGETSAVVKIDGPVTG